jgi:hypothetical protein
MIEYYDDFNTYPLIDRKQPGFDIGLNFKYLLEGNNILFLGIEYIKSETTAENKYSHAEWIFQGYPISIGYQYNITNNNISLYPFLSINIHYYFCKVNFINSSILNEPANERSNYKRNGNGFGLDGNIGLFYRLSKKIELMTELKFRYDDASVFIEHFGIEFTGVYFNVGLNYNL